MCAVSASAEPDTEQEGAAQKKVNLKGLKQETERQIFRQFKKLGKLDERKRKAEDTGGDATEVELLVMEGQERLASLNKLEEMLKGIKSVKDEAFPAAWELAQELDVKDGKPALPPRAPKKPKGKPQAPRKPYFVYTSADGLEIWVGRGAADNDVLSLQSRDPRDWWLHASGCPGSHVVIRFTDEDPPEETVLDAACLALEFSKAGGGRQGISLTRCRNVSKTPLAPPGQVLLRGDVRVIKMDLKTEQERLSRLLKTKSNGN